MGGEDEQVPDRIFLPDRLRLGAMVALGVLAIASLVGCADGSAGSDGRAGGAGGGGKRERVARSFSVVARAKAEEATGLAVDRLGRLVVGERRTGRVYRVDRKTGARRRVGLVENIDARPAQGGLLGLDASGPGALLAELTADDGHLQIVEVGATGSGRQRWRGPRSTDKAVGGRPVTLADGRLLTGVGDLLDPTRGADPTTPNTKILEIHDDGTTSPLAAGFNNPFAMTAAGNTVWVADNAPGSRQERIVRVAADGALDVVASWDDVRVPSGIAVLSDGKLAICYFAKAELRLVDPDRPGDGFGTFMADGCRYGVVALPRGGLAYATADEVVVLRPVS